MKLMLHVGSVSRYIVMYVAYVSCFRRIFPHWK